MKLQENTITFTVPAKVLNITDKIDPFLSLAFLPLPVIPEVRITDSGLFDVINFKFVE